MRRRFFVVGGADVSLLTRRAVRHTPKAPAHPAGATAVCRDGTFSYAAHHPGACFHHGGVLKFFT
jgi:hypothetical protein